jgi:hypothetical protein
LSGTASPISVGANVHRVRALIDRQRLHDFDRWLDGHLAELKHLPGYTGADILHGADEPQPAGRICGVREIIFRFVSEAAMADYERDGGVRARTEAAAQFGDSLTLVSGSLDQVTHADPRLGMLGHCKNCGAVLLGAFCASCGQRADVHVPTTIELVHEIFEGITHSDSRLWRTLRLLWLKPGKLTLEFVAGRREAYLPPFRLYLVMSVLLFLVASFIRPSEDILRVDQKAGDTHQTSEETPEDVCTQISSNLFNHFYPSWQTKLRHGCLTTFQDHGESLLHVVWTTLPKAMFIFLPLIALLHMLVYWWPRARYAEHLLFFIHLHAFYFSLITAVLLLKDALSASPRLAMPVDSLTTTINWAMAIYTVLALKRVFARSWFNTLVKAFGLLIVYSVLLTVTVVGVFVYSAMQV